MHHKLILTFLSVFILGNTFVFSQDNKTIETINKQVWEPFTKAFETNDYKLFASIHHNDLVRISGDGNSIKGLDSYIEGYKHRWEGNTRKQTISFRFLERIYNTNKASERGIYKLTINPMTKEAVSYYGKFHVILIKENNMWKISVDYDSSENKTINESSYIKAYDMTENFN